MKKIFALFGILALLSGALLAQTKTITGTIRDVNTGETLPAVNVFLRSDPTKGTATDFDGNFSLSVPESATSVIFKSVGYAEQEVSLGSGNQILNISLSDADLRLNTLVVSASKRSEKVLDAPASVTVIGRDKLETTVALSAIDNLKRVPGVDIMQTGLVSANVNIRGFNNIFSGAMLTVVDNRFAAVPSLRLNAFQFIPATNDDIERIEVVRGPGSALYGPNSSDGVLQIITRSPLDLEVGQYQTTVSMGLGIKQNTDTLREWDEANQSVRFRTYDLNERFVYAPEFRHSGRVSEKFGYKIMATYQRANDWVTYDPREPAIGTEMFTGSIRDGKPFTVDSSIAPFPFERDFESEKIAGELRLDYQPNPDLNLIMNLGGTQGTNLELTGLGGGQAINWLYWYGQIRMSWKNLFVQYFVNSSDANDTYLIPQGGNRIQQLVDKSKQHVLSVQHQSTPLDALQLIYGVDILLTRPNTEGTINGRFEDADNVNQAGVYGQGEYKFNDQWKFVAAARVDYHDPLDEFQISPRAALVYKPAPQHTLRATYNRAFSTPSTLNIALDLSNGLIPNGINVRGIGNPNGYSYERDDEGLPLFLNPYNNNYYTPFNNSNNGLFWSQFQNALAGLLAGGAGLPAAFFTGPLASVLNGMVTASGDIDLIGVDYAAVATGGSVADNTFDIAGLEDFGKVQSSITQTVELGYKGLLAKDKLFLTVDGYMTMIDNFVTPLTNVAPSMIFNPTQLAAALGPNAPGGLLHDNLLGVDPASLLVTSLDGQFGGAVDGDIYEELFALLLGANQQLTLGTVAPNDTLVGADAILTYRNLQDQVRVFGADLGFTYLLSKDASFSISYSWVNRDSIVVEGAAGGYIALNAPRNKFSLGYDHQLPKTGLSFGGTFRWNQGFPANSAIYIGRVATYNILDLRMAYQPNFSKNTRVILDMSNALGIEYRTFPGAPNIGRLTMLKLQQTF